MDIRLVRGEQVNVIRKGPDGSEQLDALVHTDAGSLVALEFRLLYGQPVPVVAGEPVVLVRTSAGVRSIAPARVRTAQRPTAWFELAESGWQEDERKSSPRASLQGACEVAGQGAGGAKLMGTLLDVSEGGMRIGLPRHVGEARLSVTLDGPSGKATLPCMLLAVEPVDEGGVALRVRYERLTRAQQDVADWLAQAPGAMKNPVL